MSKIITISIILLVIVSSSHADYLNTNNNACIHSVQPYQNNTGLCYLNSSDNVSVCDASLSYTVLLNGYEYIDLGCYLKNDLELTGLTQNEWNYFLALIAHAFGFTMLLLVNYLAVLVAKGKG